MTALFGVGAALLMMSSTSLLSWNARREAEESARSSLRAASVLLRQSGLSSTSTDKIEEILAQHNARVARGGWANEVEGWLVSASGDVKWKTGPFVPPMLDGPEDGRGGPPPGGPPLDDRFDDRPDGRPPGRGGRRGMRGRGPRGDHVPLWMQFAVPPLEDGSNWRHLEMKRGSDTLILGVPWFRNTRNLRSQMLSLLFMGLLASGAAAVGAWFLVGKVLSPIENLAGQARELAQTDSFEGRLSSTSSDAEMRHLTATLNEMLQVLGESARSKERFHTAASHELRTPLQALSGHLQVALSRFRGAEEYRTALEEAARQTERLSSLTRDLLMLNQLQMATSKPPHEGVDATEILEQCIDRSVPALDARGVNTIEQLQPCEIETAPSHLEMLMRNLVENAVKYAVDGGQISFVLRNGEMAIWNQTPNLLRDANLGRLFEPFFRPDASRHSSTGGNGLGLSICRAICDANGWEITLQSEKYNGKPGVCARVRFSPSDGQAPIG
jgi:signal transduction histidine kinase